jgi:phage shock protein C
VEYTRDMAKKLYRSRTNRKIAGVCGGLAEYFNIDATIIRVIAFLLLLPGGLPGFIPYVVLWVIVPRAPINQRKFVENQAG